MKEKGIMLNALTADLDIDPVRNTARKIIQGLYIGNCTTQNMRGIIRAHPGEFREYPLLGVGIDDMLLSHDSLVYKHKIREHLTSDGFTVSRIDIDVIGQKMEINANY